MFARPSRWAGRAARSVLRARRSRPCAPLAPSVPRLRAQEGRAGAGVPRRRVRALPAVAGNRSRRGRSRPDRVGHCIFIVFSRVLPHQVLASCQSERGVNLCAMRCRKNALKWSLVAGLGRHMITLSLMFLLILLLFELLQRVG